MTNTAAPASISDTKPIRLVSKFSGLSVRVRPGKAERIPGTDRYETSPGAWIEFRSFQAVITPKRILALFGNREDGIAWIRQHPRYRVDFWLNDDKDAAQAKPKARAGTETE